jgi:hypothetical protein
MGRAVQMRYICLVLLWGGLGSTLLQAQDFRATISGIVTDKSGAPVPNAKVTATQKSTNETTTQKSNQEGFFTLTYLMPSTYDIEVEAAGFKRLKRQDVSLMVADKVELQFPLEIGQQSQEITVSATADLLQTGDASGGMNFDSLQTSEYPLNGRQVYMLMSLTPGVLFTQEQFGSLGYSGTRGWDTSGAYVMNGGVSGTNSFSLNGAPISLTGTWQLAPNVDAIQEFKVQTNTYDASVGRTGGGSVNTTLKSGSNTWHGTLFEFMRNSVLDANYTQNNLVGAPRGKHITNQFGGTLGGTVRKDKDFVFGSFEGFRERVPFPVVANVPPTDLLDGQHFTKYGITIYDPATGVPCVSKVTISGTCSSSFIREAFPGNVIPPSRISPIGRKILSYYPAPNAPGFTQNFVFSNSTGKYHYDQPMFRWDRVVDSNDRVYALLTFQHGGEYRNQTGIPGEAVAGNINSERQNFNLITAWTRILSSSKVLDVRLSFGRFTQYFPNTDQSSKVTAASLGMTGLIQAPTAPRPAPPRIIIDQFTDLFGNGGNYYTWSTDNQWNLAPTITMTRGSKTIKFGLDMVYAMQGTGNVGNPNGQFSFTRYGTQQYPLSGAASTVGSGIADLLLGIPGAGLANWNDTYYRTWPYFGGFVQADWRVSRSLTLNLGLRYDVQIPFVERRNRVNDGFDLSTVSPVSPAVLGNWAKDQASYSSTAALYPNPPAAIVGGKLFLPANGTRRTYNTDWQDIQPRIGIAWSINQTTVLRTGFGIYHATATQGNYTDGFSQQTAYIRSNNSDQSPNAGLTGPYSLQNPFPNGLIQPSGPGLGLLTNIGNAVSFDGNQRPIPRTFQYSFGLQKRVPWAVLIDASYVGSQTVHTSVPYNLDYLPLSVFLQGQAKSSLLDTNVPNPFYGVLPKNTTLGASANIAARYLYYPYPEFTSITESNNPWGKYRYDSLQLRVTKRFNGDKVRAGALTTVFSYTFSKNFQAVNRLNNWNPAEAPAHELAGYDKPQNLSFSGVWVLPLGRKGAWLHHVNPWVNGAVGGWSMNYIFTYNSGIPVSGINTLFLCDTVLTADQTHDHWFNNNKTCYKGYPNGYYLRNVPDRYAWLRQMDNLTMNLSMAKTFDITEKWKFNLRGEAFNLMNHPLYGAPDTNYTDARFGMLPVAQQNFPRLVQVSAKILF